MKKKGTGYNIINIAVIMAAAALFIYDYSDYNALFQNMDICRMIVICITVITVHAIKSGRLYLTLYGSNIRFSTYIKIYCKVTPVSVIFPYKIGEFFRMYCYGCNIGNLLKGIIIVIMDRFMDTIALVTMILLVWMFNGGHITAIVYALLMFIVLALLMYFTFPGIYVFWKKYFLRARATERRLTALKVLDKLHLVYDEITKVSRGRGIILYFMSLIAWTIEIGSLIMLNDITQEGEINMTISTYLSSAMGSGSSIELRQFVFMSVIVIIIMYVILKLKEMAHRKKAN